MKKYLIVFCFSLLACGFEANACGNINVPKENVHMPLLSSPLDLLDSGSKPLRREALHGAVFVLHGNFDDPASQWDFSTPHGEAKFFRIARELELIRNQALPQGAGFYRFGGYELGNLELILDRATWDEVNQLPQVEEKTVDISSGKTGVGILDWVAMELLATKLKIRSWFDRRPGSEISGGRTYFRFDRFWIYHLSLVESLKKRTGVVSANINSAFCTPRPQLIQWVGDSTYVYKAPSTGIQQRFFVDLEAGTVKAL